MVLSKYGWVMIVCLSLFFSCAFLEDVLKEDTTPTKTRMEGIWELTEAYNEADSSILKKISFPTVAFHLQSDRTVTSTAGPMIMYIVYGGSKYVEIASKIDQVFDYTKIKFNNGEFFIKGGVVDRFTLEMKLEGLPGQKSLTELLSLLKIGNDFLDVVIYHKFLNVNVSFSPTSNDTMYWEFDDITTAEYNTKDDETAQYILWKGWPVNTFSRCKFTLVKRVKTLEQIIKEAGNIQ